MIQTRGLTKHYGATTAVGGLGFDVRPGAVTGSSTPTGREVHAEDRASPPAQPRRR